MRGQCQAEGLGRGADRKGECMAGAHGSRGAKKSGKRRTERGGDGWQNKSQEVDIFIDRVTGPEWGFCRVDNQGGMQINLYCGEARIGQCREAK